MPKHYTVTLTKTTSNTYKVPVIANCVEDAIDLAKMSIYEGEMTTAAGDVVADEVSYDADADDLDVSEEYITQPPKIVKRTSQIGKR